MAITKVNFDNKVSTITSPLPEINRITGGNVNEIKTAINNNADELTATNTNITGMQTITTGTGTINTTYIDSAENNHWERVGQIVSYAFTLRAKGTWSSTTEFLTGLPKPKAAVRFVGTNSSNSSAPVLRIVLTANGTLQNAYSQAAPAANQNIEGQITYITID